MYLIFVIMQNGTKDLMDLMKNIQDPSIHVGPKELTSNAQPKRIYWYSGGVSKRGKFKTSPYILLLI